MPRERDEFAPRNKKEPHKWKCQKCNTKGKAASKEDAQLALALHIAMMHD